MCSDLSRYDMYAQNGRVLLASCVNGLMAAWVTYMLRSETAQQRRKHMMYLLVVSQREATEERKEGNGQMEKPTSRRGR